jgi:abhydrolase domain-containing protein 6
MISCASSKSPRWAGGVRVFRSIVKLLLGFFLLLLLVIAGGSRFFPEDVARLAAHAERQAAGLERKEIDVAGFRIVYLEGGKGEPLVLVHGFGAEKDNWTRVARYLTPHFRVIALDLPGFGETSKPEDASYTVTSQVEYLRAFVRALNLGEVSLGGNSMGGWIAGLYAANYPTEVKSLWLVAPAGVATAEQSELGQRMIAGGSNPLLARTPEDFDNIVEFVMTDPPYIPGSIKKVLAQRAATNYPFHARIFDQILKENAPLEPRLAGLPVLTRVVWGDGDRALHVSGAKILGTIMPNATVVVMPGIGHLPMLENPKGSADDYLAFRSRKK